MRPQGEVRSAGNAIEGKNPERLNKAFHVQMAGTCIVLAVMAIVGCRVADVQVPGAAMGALGFVLLIAGTFPVLAYWGQKRQFYRLDAGLTIYWIVIVKVLLGYVVVTAARLGMEIGLQDGRLAQVDQMLGVTVAQLSAWAPQHWFGRTANASYGLLTGYILAAVLVPIFTRRLRWTQRFLTANVISFAIGLPMFVLTPAVGPWYGIHFAPSQSQAACESAFLLLRQPGPREFGDAGIICFPSFHAIWSVLCAYPLWQIRWLRVPAMVLSGLILFSTVSTGWHYFSDVAAGVAVAGLSILISNWLGSQQREIVAETGLAAEN